MQNILSTVGAMSHPTKQKNYTINIFEELSLRSDGTVNESLNPFSEINLAKELKKDYSNQHFHSMLQK